MKKTVMFVLLAAALVGLGFTPQSAMAVGSVSGTVIDAEGNAVAGAVVMVQGIQHRRGQRPFMSRSETDDNGAFSVGEIPAGRYVVAAMARELGGARAEAEIVDDANTEVNLQLRGVREGRGGHGEDEEVATGSLTGTVLDADGNVVADARVVLVPARMAQRGHRVRPIQLLTDVNGDFGVEAIPAGVWVVTAAKRGVGMARDRITIEADGALDVTLTLQMRE